MAEKIEKDFSRKSSPSVAITAIICATVVFVSILWVIFAIFALNKGNEIVKDLPKDLKTVNITVNQNRK
jgi:hypothetical protein